MKSGGIAHRARIFRLVAGHQHGSGTGQGHSHQLVVAAIESPASCETTDVVFAGLSIMLGRTGIAAAERDCARIRETGLRPLIVQLISGVTVVITSVAFEPSEAPRLH